MPASSDDPSPDGRRRVEKRRQVAEYTDDMLSVDDHGIVRRQESDSERQIHMTGMDAVLFDTRQVAPLSAIAPRICRSS